LRFAPGFPLLSLARVGAVFSHKPTRINYWHFELWVKDSAGVRMPRDKSNIHARYLAKSLLEYITASAVVFKAETIPFKCPEFD
jgi:hypothetical protein